MKLALFQFDVVLGEPAVNLARIVEGTRGLHADLLLLPELATSGYLPPRGAGAPAGGRHPG